MKKILLTLGVFTLSSLMAQTTMCYKENLTSPSQSETVTLDGGKCAGTKSAQDMQNEGWEIGDIKISSTKKGMNYTYIFKKGEVATQTAANLSEEELMQKIMARMNAQQKQKAKEEKIKKEIAVKERIKSYYIEKCQVCHGEKGELNARGTSRPLNSLTAVEMDKSILAYSRNKYDRGLAIIMYPYLSFATEDKLVDIEIYLKSLNNK